MKRKIISIIKRNLVLNRLYESQRHKKLSNLYLNYLNKISNVLKEEKIEFWLDYGTLLGAVRDNDFIKGDDDLDIGIYYFDENRKIAKLLEQHGIKKMREFYLNNQLVEETYIYNGLKFDIFYYFKDKEDDKKVTTFYFLFNGNDYVLDKKTNFKIFKNIQTVQVFNEIEGLKKINLRGQDYPIPTNYHEYLISNYGPNYHIPNAKWDSLNDATNVLVREDLKAECIYHMDY